MYWLETQGTRLIRIVSLIMVPCGSRDAFLRVETSFGEEMHSLPEYPFVIGDIVKLASSLASDAVGSVLEYFPSVGEWPYSEPGQVFFYSCYERWGMSFALSKLNGDDERLQK